MKRVLQLTIVLVAMLSVVERDALAQQDEGEELFNGVCVACHTINGGKLIGPDLANVHKRRPLEWIVPFVKSSQSVIKGGDPYAVALFEEFNNMIMPDNNFTDAQVMSVINYIAANSPGGPAGGTSGRADVPEQPVTQENIRSGRMLFVGESRLTNGGPTCNSCHDVQLEGIMAGGALAKDLTDAYSRLTGPGVRGMIANSPFPPMKQAFEGKPLTDEELFDLTAFLQYVDSEGASKKVTHYRTKLLLSGFGGAIAIVILFSGVWVRVKKRSVNHSIYERQVKSTWE
jgi:mono/diheme cytochrome c family protein